MSNLNSCNLPGGLYPTMFCSEMRCFCSRQTFILWISFNHIPSIEKSVPFFCTIAKTMFFPASFRDTVRYQGEVPSFGFEVTGISDGLEAKKSPGLQSKPNNIFPPLPPPPPTHTHKKRNKQTDKNKKKKIRSLMKPHSHKKYLVKFSTAKNQGIRKPHPPPPKKFFYHPPHLESGPPPGYREYPQMICFFHQN